MTDKSKKVIDWRKRTKERIVQSFGGKCGVCGYDKCQDALDLHHLDPTQKEFSLASIRAWPKSWASIVVELRKCAMLCCRCHREFHSGLLSIPQDVPQFDEKFADYKTLERLDRQSKNMKKCPVCKKDMVNRSKTCSLSCAARLTQRYDWDSYDLHDLYVVKNMSYSAISKIVGCSGVAVTKRLKKLNLIPG